MSLKPLEFAKPPQTELRHWIVKFQPDVKRVIPRISWNSPMSVVSELRVGKFIGSSDIHPARPGLAASGLFHPNVGYSMPEREKKLAQFRRVAVFKFTSDLSHRLHFKSHS